jgi:hypothetical protein
MKKLKDTENNLLNRIYYNNFKNGTMKKQSGLPITKVQNRTHFESNNEFNSKMNELDRSLNIKAVLNQINKTSVPKEKKTMLKSILRKHYFSENKIKPQLINQLS